MESICKLCVAKPNCDWSAKITPLSNLSRVSLVEELTAKAELNCEIFKKVLEKSSQFLSKELKKFSRKTCGCSQLEAI